MPITEFVTPKSSIRLFHALASLALAGLAIVLIGSLLGPLLTFVGTLIASYYTLAFLFYIIKRGIDKISGKSPAGSVIQMSFEKISEILDQPTKRHTE